MGRTATVLVLLKHGAQVDILNNVRVHKFPPNFPAIIMIIITLAQAEATPLSSACALGFTATVRVLLEHGASVDLCDKVRNIQHMHTHFE